MNTRMGGDPMRDSEPSRNRFSNTTRPLLESHGFYRLSGNSHIMVNDERKVIVLCRSCPSNLKDKRYIKSKMTSITREFGKEYKVYIHYSRPRIEWSNKPVYQGILRGVRNLTRHSGVIFGRDLPMKMNSINNGEFVV